jgi:putative phosphoesterase
MKIGIIADTHNDIKMAKKAIEFFKKEKVELVIHAGDLTSPKIIEIFKGLNCKFVLGNADIDIEIINQKSEEMGFGCVDTYCDFMVEDKRFIVFHGNDIPMFRKVVASGKYDYIIKGHTHFYENYISNNTRIINPGSLFGEDEHTIAILDTETEKVEKIRIEADDE